MLITAIRFATVVEVVPDEEDKRISLRFKRDGEVFLVQSIQVKGLNPWLEFAREQGIQPKITRPHRSILKRMRRKPTR